MNLPNWLQQPEDPWAHLKEQISYDPKTHKLHKHKRRAMYALKDYTTVRQIRIGKERYTTTHVVWYLCTGQIPNQVEQIDDDYFNRKITNLMCDGMIWDSEKGLIPFPVTIAPHNDHSSESA